MIFGSPVSPSVLARALVGPSHILAAMSDSHEAPEPIRIWLDVPFHEKDEAKALGARWDSSAKRWFAAPCDLPGLDRWTALPDVPNLLQGEDRSLGSGLFVDLVPSSCWFTNV